jgi:hypothetical protein
VEGLGNLARDLGRGMSDALEALLEPAPPKVEGKEPSHPAFWSPELLDQPHAAPGQAEGPSSAARDSPSDVASSMRGGVSALTSRAATRSDAATSEAAEAAREAAARQGHGELRPAAQAAREGRDWGPLEESPGSKRREEPKEAKRAWDPGAGGP